MRQKGNLLAAVLIAAQCDGEPVTYLILTLRLNGFGGDRICRGLVDKMKRAGFVDVSPSQEGGDRRTKTVRLTSAGWNAVKGYGSLVAQLLASRRN
jgi:hypothetical protein